MMCCLPPLPSKDIVNAPNVWGLPWHNGYQRLRLRALRVPPWLTFSVPPIAHDAATLHLNSTASSTATTGTDTVDPWWSQTWYRGYAGTAPSAFTWSKTQPSMESRQGVESQPSPQNPLCLQTLAYCLSSKLIRFDTFLMLVLSPVAWLAIYKMISGHLTLTVLQLCPDMLESRVKTI